VGFEGPLLLFPASAAFATVCNGRERVRESNLGTDENPYGHSHCTNCTPPNRTQAFSHSRPLCLRHLRRLHAQAHLNLTRLRPPFIPHLHLLQNYPRRQCHRHRPLPSPTGIPRNHLRRPHGPPPRGVRNRRVGEALGEEEELHQAVVPSAGDARRGVARREGEIGGGQRRAAAGENLRRHREVPVHQQAGAPLRD